MRQSKSKDYCSNDLTSFEESELDFLPSQFELLQIIKEPTHILKNSKPCRDFIFTFQPNMIIGFGLVYMLLYTRIVTTKLYRQSLL